MSNDMHIEFLVEEPSTEAALRYLVPHILGDKVTFCIHPYQGKTDLLKKLPARLQSYANWIPPDWYIVVLLDRDDDDCRALKVRLEDHALQVGLTTRSTVESGMRFQVLNRIIIEELEAWFFGDCDAIRSAYPRLPKDIERRERYRNPDNIHGGTWEALEQELQKQGYHRGGLAKITASRDISRYMKAERNKSKSFQSFREGLIAIKNLHREDDN